MSLNSVQIRAGYSKFQEYRVTILHADFLKAVVFMQVIVVPYENILSSHSINLVNLISAMHVTRQQPLKTTPFQECFAISNIFPTGCWKLNYARKYLVLIM